jgi:hypothetical protein
MKNKNNLYSILFSTLMLSLLGNAHASIITYDTTFISGNRWEYTYTVANDTLAFDIEEFSIYFDVGVYENLTIGSIPADWDPLVFQPDPGIPADGVYDALALVSGIAPGDMLGIFSVLFDYLGAGTPGNQAFEIVDPFTFVALDSGVTVTEIASVPEPPGMLLFGMGVFLFLKRKRISTVSMCCMWSKLKLSVIYS